ncbi:hypothetical protein DFH08DRAFT_1085264 [Mycena albidolilacea]|uniref:DUF6534 domain-containing protein n=1 Tax=Mycena albidolilacea TaxID=1033008 RepID=A0AAD6ZIX1_9AGAR|nr:hypothetical protein DFH08DRAFT_1085264 [Mycena albidolilacea]
MAVTSAIRALQAAHIKTFAALIPFGDAWLALSVVCDLSLTTLLFIYLRRSRTGFFKTDNVITRLTIQSIETASFSTINSMVDLITFTVLPNTNFHFVFALLSGRMYTNTLLATLNFRTKLREDMGGVHSIPTAIRGPQMHGSVEQNQEVDIALEGYPRGRKSSGIPAVSNGSQTSAYQDRKSPAIA